MRGLTLTVPCLVNLIDLLHVYMPMVMRGSTLTVPSLVIPIDLLHNVHAYMYGERVNPLRTFLYIWLGSMETLYLVNSNHIQWVKNGNHRCHFSGNFLKSGNFR